MDQGDFIQDGKKRREPVNVPLPILVLQDAGPRGDLACIVGAHGKPFTKERFRKAFSDATR